MDIQKIIIKMNDEKKIFKPYCWQNEKQRKAFLFYNLCMNTYILEPDEYLNRRAALHFIKRYKQASIK